MSSVRIYRNDRAGEVFVARGTIGSWPFDCLQAVGNGDGTVSIRNKARSYADDSDFFELSNIAYADLIKADDSAWGSSETETVNNLNAMFVDSPDTGVAPVYTAATAVTVTDAEVLNYYATADGAVGWEWASLPAGLAVSSHNPRQLVGTFTGGAGTYNVDVTAVNYYGSTTTTITFTVTATFADTKSVFLESQDYLGAIAAAANPLYRASNGAGSGDAWTISLWFMPSSNNQTQTILFFGGNDLANEGAVRLEHRGADDHVRLYYGSNNNYLRLDTPDSSVTDGTWHHILVTYDGGTTGAASGDISDYYGRFEVWIDGVSQTLTTANGNYGWSGSIPADLFRIGKRGNASSHMRSGYVNELALWASDETSNAAAIYNSGSPHDLSALGSAPDHWWRMGDGDTYPTIQDNVGSLDFTMTNQTASNIVTDAP